MCGLNRLFSILHIAIRDTADLCACRWIVDFECFTGLRRDPLTIDVGLIEKWSTDWAYGGAETQQGGAFRGIHSIWKNTAEFFDLTRDSRRGDHWLVVDRWALCSDRSSLLSSRGLSTMESVDTKCRREPISTRAWTHHGRFVVVCDLGTTKIDGNSNGESLQKWLSTVEFVDEWNGGVSAIHPTLVISSQTVLDAQVHSCRLSNSLIKADFSYRHWTIDKYWFWWTTLLTRPERWET